MILAESPADENDALEELRVAQRDDFVEILHAMDGLPVTVRLLDPPLHEFLPNTEELAVKDASVGLTEEEEKLYQASRAWKEVNPMLGTRGVRLGVIKPGLYEMQVRALLEAARICCDRGESPIIEIMIPLTVTKEELSLARSWVTGVLDTVDSTGITVTIGTMIETPRAALRADEIAEFAEFFSFGTNDLTQMTLGFSRDDVEGKMMATYIDQGLLPANPFKTLDVGGVGELVKVGVARGRATRPGLKIGVCGEHGGDPASIEFFVSAGVDYVSCSPFRVPIARLAAAHALIALESEGGLPSQLSR
jgi:pyruvate,orthophosphate dikinase